MTKPDVWSDARDGTNFSKCSDRLGCDVLAGGRC